MDLSISFLLCFERCFDSEVWRKILASADASLNGPQVLMSIAVSSSMTDDLLVHFQESDGLEKLKNGLTPSGNCVLNFCSQKKLFCQEKTTSNK